MMGTHHGLQAVMNWGSMLIRICLRVAVVCLLTLSAASIRLRTSHGKYFRNGDGSFGFRRAWREGDGDGSRHGTLPVLHHQ